MRRISVPVADAFHHQNSTPNCSRLGVLVSAPRKPRGDHACFACARGVHGLGQRVAGSTLFCSLFSQNLHQLFRGGTRTLPVSAMHCQCVSSNSFSSNLDRQNVITTMIMHRRTGLAGACRYQHDQKLRAQSNRQAGQAGLTILWNKSALWNK